MASSPNGGSTGTTGSASVPQWMRTLVAMLFFLVWLGLLIYDVLTPEWSMPTWLEAAGLGLIGYILGVPLGRLAGLVGPTGNGSGTKNGS